LDDFELNTYWASSIRPP